jgi:hypothetical protein
MGDYSNEIAALIGTLHNPRYATQDPPASAPVLFDGELTSQFVTFVAHPDDPHDYGVEVWTKAQAGEYGPIAPYTPYPELPATGPIGPDGSGVGVQPVVDGYFYACVRQIVTTVAEAEVLHQATAVLNANGRKMPGGARGAAISSFAATRGVPVDELVAMILALDDLRFVHLTARAVFNMNGNKAQFDATMTEALEEFNAASPVKIEAPQ